MHDTRVSFSVSTVPIQLQPCTPAACLPGFFLILLRPSSHILLEIRECVHFSSSLNFFFLVKTEVAEELGAHIFSRLAFVFSKLTENYIFAKAFDG